MNAIKLAGLLLVATLCFGPGCTTTNESSEPPTSSLVQAPAFSADSAFAFVARQVAFGPRVPNTPAHRQAGDYLAAALKNYGLQVTEQPFTATTYDGKKLNARNIIGSFNPQAAKRILLAAHWDSRPFADEDSTASLQGRAVPAANDGASGVGVLLEVARVLGQSTTKPDIGVDIIFFDAEDWGNSQQAKDKFSGFCLGSQYWAANRHVAGYTAYYGILLDMVGAKGATFPKEGYSMQYGADVVNRVWNIASQLGYNQYFIDQPGPAITDDHVPVNEIARFPMIDIIHLRVNEPGRTFFNDWHTTGDTMENIDPATLKAVGQTLLQVIYQESQPI
jgi:glutaminyl-peptide cyclotransferase